MRLELRRFDLLLLLLDDEPDGVLVVGTRALLGKRDIWPDLAPDVV